MAFAGILFKVFMKEFKVFLFIATLSPLLLVSVNGQINSPCTASMISSYTPCMNYITGSSRNGASPTVACCNILKNLMSTSVACTCLVLTANVPLLPINRTLALSLPRACHMDSLPMQCEASGAPLPAPGPVIFGPTPLTAGAPLSPRASKATALAPAPAPAPGPETTQPVTPASPTVQAEAPTTTAGIRPVLSPSASVLSCISPPSSTLILLAIIVIKSY